MRYTYDKVASDEEENVNRRASRTSGMNLLTTLLAFVLGIVIGGISVFYSRPNDVRNSLDPPGDNSVTLHYNKTFGKPPSEPVDQAWSSIFPVGRGFVQPPGASNISGVAVFHELHCLNALRISLYEFKEEAALLSSSSSETKSSDSGSNSSSGASHFHHVRHCIDYLRQSLMCHADTNLEPVNWTAGGVTGWGSERKCRDYDAVVQWANDYRTHDQTDIS